MTSRQWREISIVPIAVAALFFAGCGGPHIECWNERDGSSAWTGGKLTGYTCCQPMSSWASGGSPTGPPVCRPFVRETK